MTFSCYEPMIFFASVEKSLFFFFFYKDVSWLCPYAKKLSTVLVLYCAVISNLSFCHRQLLSVLSLWRRTNCLWVHSPQRRVYALKGTLSFSLFHSDCRLHRCHFFLLLYSSLSLLLLVANTANNLPNSEPLLAHCSPSSLMQRLKNILWAQCQVGLRIRIGYIYLPIYVQFQQTELSFFESEFANNTAAQSTYISIIIILFI